MICKQNCEEKISWTERFIGHFAAPSLMGAITGGLAGAYLIQFYTDVLGLAGALIVWMPALAKVASSLTGVLFGWLIDHTHTKFGKARPWLLASGALMGICGMLLYSVPSVSVESRMVWVMISYNLFFSFVFPAYGMSHGMLVSLSTRNQKQRDGFALLSSIASSMIPGILVTIIMPILVRWMGVGQQAQMKWLTVMGLFSAAALPVAVLEFCFTRERVCDPQRRNDEVSFWQQLKACIQNPGWVTVTVYVMLMQLANVSSNTSMLYYCNWVLGNSVQDGVKHQLMVNIIGQAPMGYGVLFLPSLIRRYGKEKVSETGFAIAVLGSLIVWLAGKRMPWVLTGLFVKSTGMVAGYLMPAFQADALETIERSAGFRADGCSLALMGICQNAAAGAAYLMMTCGMQAFGYIAPASTFQVVVQPQMVQYVFICCFVGIPLLCYAGCAVCMRRQKLTSARNHPFIHSGIVP